MIGPVHFRRGDQSIQIKAQLVVETLLHRAAKQTGQNETTDDETEHAPHGCSGDQPEGERIGLRKETSQLCSSAALGSSSLYPSPRTV